MSQRPTNDPTERADMGRWECGSEFHWLSYAPEPPAAMPWPESARFHGCARDSLRALIAHGQAARGWRRLWIPSYFCQRVVASLLDTGIPIRVYEDGPWGGSLAPLRSDGQPGDAALRVRYFGLRAGHDPSWLRDGPVELVEDHSHDPWSRAAYESRADWCVVSLRKTLPVPDGGVLWSPAGHALPPAAPVTRVQQDLSLRRLTGMMLKGLYLQGHDTDKTLYRRLMADAEEQFARGAASGLPEWTGSLLRTFPVAAWRQRKARNHRTLRECLAAADGVHVLPPEDEPDTCPFSAILVFDSAERRERTRRSLISCGVYPAVLWPLDETVVPGVPETDRAYSRRMLSVHCDMRYETADMMKVASLIGECPGVAGRMDACDAPIPAGGERKR